MIQNSPSMARWRPILNYQWQFIPMLNPDGYQNSHETDHDGSNIGSWCLHDLDLTIEKVNEQVKVREFSFSEKFRMHRKNMRPLSAMDLNKSMLEKCHDEGNCEGVDLNRNFPSGWGLGHETFVKESNDPSMSVYKEPSI